ncbi:hypothetical protein BX600DRAFT_436470 [Xylariales sp. PMI_506]|nr:hypothetical protein BX600DRAFT_436470 [Xylariales sp. PMI_506]
MSVIPIELRPIAAEEVVHLRHAVLWPGLPLDKQLMPLDTLPTTRHFGAFITRPVDEPASPTKGSSEISTFNKILESVSDQYLPQSGASQRPVGVMTLSLESFAIPDQLPDHMRAVGIEVQLHKFAVMESLQGLGIGGQMLREACSILPTIHRTVPNSASASIGELQANSYSLPILLHFDARASQQHVYRHWGFSVLSDAIFTKRGPSGSGSPVQYVKMGRLLP